MDIFLARQPIFDARKKIYAYEMLYRSNCVNAFTTNVDPDKASASVIINTFQTFGLDVLTNNRPVFINFTENLLLNETATLIPRECLVIEILESVEATKKTVETCRHLKQQDYMLALDDFVYQPEYEPLIELADIIKIDFIKSSRPEIEEMVALLQTRDVVLLAEKIESNEEFIYAQQLGFSLFQGFFFSKPQMLSTKAIAPHKATYLQLLGTLNHSELDVGELSRIISQDLAMLYRLLRWVNSVAFGFKNRIQRPKHALALLGDQEVRKWISLMILQNLGNDKPDELVRLSLIRARFAELLALRTKFKNHAHSLFLAGLFSLLNVILDRSMEEMLEEVKASEEVKACLLDNTSDISQIYQLILMYEQGNWQEVFTYADNLKLDYQIIGVVYVAALEWYNGITAA